MPKKYIYVLLMQLMIAKKIVQHFMNKYETMQQNAKKLNTPE